MYLSLITGSICTVALAGFIDFEILAYFTETCQDILVNSCHIDPSPKEIDMSTKNTINWFDKACYDSWDYFKGGISPHINNNTKEFIDYWLHGTATEPNCFDKVCWDAWCYLKDIGSTVPIINNDGTCEELVVTSEAQANYFVFGLSFLLIACAIFADIDYNFDMLKAAYTIIDQRLYDILCMFDFPGFMVDKRSVMPLGEGYEFVVEHFWGFYTDPADNRLGLSHLASYTLHHDDFWLQFNSLPPAWSVPSYLDITIVPGLHWPFNYDHFHYITLFTF